MMSGIYKFIYSCCHPRRQIDVIYSHKYSPYFCVDAPGVSVGKTASCFFIVFHVLSACVQVAGIWELVAVKLPTELFFYVTRHSVTS